MRARHRAQAAATAAVLAGSALAVSARAAAPAEGVAAPVPPAVAAVDDTALVRAAQRRASRAERRHETHVRALRRARAAASRARAAEAAARRLAAVTASSSAWAHTRKAIGVANCESGPGPSAPRYDRYVGDPHLADPNGHYGKWQFAPATADSVGAPGAGIAALPEAEQDHYAYLLFERDGWSQWECASEV